MSMVLSGTPRLTFDRLTAAEVDALHRLALRQAD
jgi:hypothetical protein